MTGRERINQDYNKKRETIPGIQQEERDFIRNIRRRVKKKKRESKPAI